MAKEETGQATKRTAIGGQAVLEGLMMMGPDKIALAVRLPDGSISLEYLSADKPASRAAAVPVLRGGVRLFRQLVIGVKALLRSADLMEEEPETEEPETEEPQTEPIPVETELDVTDEAEPLADSADVVPSDEKASKPPKKDSGSAMLYASAALGILLGVGLFILLPNLITGLLNRVLPIGEGYGFGGTVLKNLIEGAFRILLFVGYVALTSRQKDIRRVWMYHGAEHKTIACYEHDLPLTVENIRPFSPRHPRCGTSSLFVVMLISILLFAFAGWHSAIINLLIRLALVPLVAGIAYEIIRWAGRHDNALSRLVSLPGLAMQRLTAKEPDDDMIEVAIEAMKAVIPEQSGRDEW
ncbi:MAG: DUF1385 domain-containing protein [Clostridiaceae bacterium]|nr:DUF1385 domain-containing protein [Clostridiaceae bacterium]